MVTKPKNVTTVRFDDEDKRILDALVEHFKARSPKISHAEVLRIAVRDLARREGVIEK